MGRRRYLVGAIGLVVLAGVAVLVAAHTNPEALGGADAAGDGSTAPALEAKGWINSPPLTPADLAGKVVVYDFWTYSCVNCVRTIPYVRSWYDRYKDDGLVVIGVHSPEFDFEKDHANVRQGRQGARRRLSRRARRRHDHLERVRATSTGRPTTSTTAPGTQADVHFGEGGYSATEDTIRKLLGVPALAPRAVVGDARGRHRRSAEHHAGDLQRLRARCRRASPRPSRWPTAPRTFTAPADLRRRRPCAATVRGPCRPSTSSRPPPARRSCCATPPARSTSSWRPPTGQPDRRHRAGRRPAADHGDGQRRRSLLARRRSDPTGRTRCGSPPTGPGPPGLRVHVRRLTPPCSATTSPCSGPGSRRSWRRAWCRWCPPTSASSWVSRPTRDDPAQAVPATLIFVAGFATVFAVVRGDRRARRPVARPVAGRGAAGRRRGDHRVRARPARRRRAARSAASGGSITTLPKVAGPARPFVVGVAFGAAWSPCVGPLLGAALVVAAHSRPAGPGRPAAAQLRPRHRRAVPHRLARPGLVARLGGLAAAHRTTARARGRRVLLVVLGRAAGDRPRTARSRRTWPGSRPPSAVSDPTAEPDHRPMTGAASVI